MQNLNRTFFYSVTAALALTFLSIFVRVPMPVAIGCELAPLGYYYYTLRQRALTESLSQTAIDSIYYFGFIITIFALAASVFRVYWFGFGNDLVAVVGHFAVGLLATGLALVFRMLLTAQTEALNAKDLGESIEDYIRRVNQVVTTVEASAANFEGLAQSLQTRTEKVISAAHQSFSTSLVESSQVFQEQIKQIIGKADEAVREFHGTVEAVTKSSHIETFDANMGQIVGGLRNFAKEMIAYGQRITQEASTANANAISATHKSYVEHLEGLYSKNSELLSAGLEQIQRLDFTSDAAIVKGDLQGLSRAISGFNKKFAELESRLGETVATHSAQAAQTVIEKFAGEVVDIVREMEEAITKSTNEVANGLQGAAERKIAAIGATAQEGVSQQVGQVADEVSMLRQALEGFRASLDSTRQARESDELAMVVHKTRGLLEELNGALTGAINHCNILMGRATPVSSISEHLREPSFLTGSETFRR